MHYLQRYMCVPDLCPCSEKINATSFGTRQIELEELDIKTGKAHVFYEHCYTTLTNGTLSGPTGKLAEVEPKPRKFLELLQQLEFDNNCQGLCETSLFYFFRSSANGPPPQSCREPIINYFWQHCGFIALFCLWHGFILTLFFIVQFRFWISFGS